jgi:uncharacterized DUF497 family protein
MGRTNVAGFDWDEGNLAKCQKHGVSVAEIEAVFEHFHRIAPDFAHSIAETRFLAIGSGGGPRPIFVAFTLRRRGGEALIRPISARYMHRKEIANYDEEATTQADQ